MSKLTTLSRFINVFFPLFQASFSSLNLLTIVRQPSPTRFFTSGKTCLFFHIHSVMILFFLKYLFHLVLTFLFLYHVQLYGRIYCYQTCFWPVSVRCHYIRGMWTALCEQHNKRNMLFHCAYYENLYNHKVELQFVEMKQSKRIIFLDSLPGWYVPKDVGF